MYTILKSGNVKAAKAHHCTGVREWIHNYGVFNWDNQSKLYVINPDYQMSEESRIAIQRFIDSKFTICKGETHLRVTVKEGEFGTVYDVRYPLDVYKAMVELNLFDED